MDVTGILDAMIVDNQYEKELINVQAKLEVKEFKLEAVQSQLTDAENGWTKSKAGADTLCAQSATGSVNRDKGQGTYRLLEQVRALKINAGMYAFNHPKAIPHASESVVSPVLTPTTPSHLTFPPACDHNDPHICPSVSFTRDTTHQPPFSSFTLPARKEGISKIIKAAPGYLDMSNFIVKIPFKEWVNKDMETS